MAEIQITLDGVIFRRQYLLYIIEISHKDDKIYYIGQTGDNKHTTARPAFRRLAAHFEDVGQSTQNQIYRFLAAEVLGITEAASRNSAFSERIKQEVEEYLVKSTTRMYVYPLEAFLPGIQHTQHLEIVRRVTGFENLVINIFMANTKRLANRKFTFPRNGLECPYPKALSQILVDFDIKEINNQNLIT